MKPSTIHVPSGFLPVMSSLPPHSASKAGARISHSSNTKIAIVGSAFFIAGAIRIR